MGLTIRRGNYKKRVRLGKRTVKDGEAAVIWSNNGRLRQVIGPSMEYMWFSTIQFLDKFSANNNQYLFINYSNGRQEVCPGPITTYLNPVIHSNIEVREAVRLSSKNDVLVIYKECRKVFVGNPVDVKVNNYTTSDIEEFDQPLVETSTNEMKGEVELSSKDEDNDTALNQKNFSRRIVRGPIKVIPGVDEWIHKFVWSGHTTGQANSVAAGANKFTILHTNVQRWHVDVDIKTRDNARLVANLCFSYHPTNIETLIDGVNDPIAYLWSGLQSDVVNLGYRFTSDEALHNTETTIQPALCSLSSYPTLKERMRTVGFDFQEVIFRGMQASDELEKRVQMEAKRKAEIEAAGQRERLKRLELENMESRAASEHMMARKQMDHEIELATERAKSRLAETQAADEQRILFLKNLKELDVDITRYLCETHPNFIPPSPPKSESERVNR